MQVHCTKSRFFIVYFFTKSLFLKCRCCTKTRFWTIEGGQWVWREGGDGNTSLLLFARYYREKLLKKEQAKVCEVGDKKIAPKDDFFD